MSKAVYVYEIQELAKEVPVEQTMRFLCPHCGGGSTKERSLSIVRRSSTEAFFNCFRSKCSLGGGHIALYQAEDGSVIRSSSKKPTTSRLVHNLAGLDQETVDFFRDTYYITPIQMHYGRLRTTFDRRVYMTMFDTRRLSRGGVVRKYKKLYVGRREWASIPKTLNYFTESSDRITTSWYYNKRSRTKNSDTLVIVEDIVSALRLTDYTDSVSILGTSLSDSKQKEIRGQRYKDIVLALDEDATTKAARIKKNTTLYLPQLRIMPLSKDIKDSSPKELEELLNDNRIL